MFRLRSQVGTFYTGRAGEAFVHYDINEAFGFATKAEAERKAAMLNRMSLLHKLTFSVEG